MTKKLLGPLLSATLALTACSSASDDGTTTAAAAGCAPASGPVTLTYTSWIPNIEQVVKVWNDAHPDIQVKVQTGPNGNGGTYQNFFNQLKAGNAPDLGQIEYDALPGFRVQDGLTNLAGCKPVTDAKDLFVDWTWNQVTFGEQNAVYGVPQDAGPMALFYRKDLFEKNGIAVPATWEEYAKAAEKVKAAGGYITNFSQSDINQFAGLVWQAGGRWFGNDGTRWTVNLQDQATTRVAGYWQDLISRNLVSAVPPWTTEWDNAYNKGQAWTWVSAVWGANSISSGAPDTSGKWAVAPMPQWTAGGRAAGNWGGSSTAVFKGAKHPYEAAQFAIWLNTSQEALTLLNEKANLYPATRDGARLPALAKGVEFYGGQKIYDVFAEASTQVTPDFTWGPTMTSTYTAASDGFKAAVSGDGTLLDALKKAQTTTIENLKSQSIPVAE
ncbi:ABC transporter substrate-binding protein [Actinoplanes teichomyceticus]|uniref:Multiple sugar transport system substrate-binding protein n=1 Tax=Actinoplanes teichomyceticus TaxID=1867 RepID=A0A561VS45_ACTTI|nr:extracellular solute-binding protein [Actinoplanes teichomyceticus]TWG14421.1 multiple sugar transport system substrate-binding protein [Actinoplanes teichomyceticus]GIF16222.1 sugar ABC transporter substrate-binding protein [Actinoplanes teichomyceticus]